MCSLVSTHLWQKRWYAFVVKYIGTYGTRTYTHTLPSLSLTYTTLSAWGVCVCVVCVCLPSNKNRRRRAEHHHFYTVRVLSVPRATYIRGHYLPPHLAPSTGYPLGTLCHLFWLVLNLFLYQPFVHPPHLINMALPKSHTLYAPPFPLFSPGGNSLYFLLIPPEC